MYAWIQEHRRVPTPPALCGDYSYAGCISTPRVVTLLDGRLHQEPLPEITRLRTRWAGVWLLGLGLPAPHAYLKS